MKWLTFILLPLSLMACKSLAPSFSENSTLKTQFYVDELMHTYTISPNNTLLKFDQNGKMIFEYSDNTLGPITSFDVSNPLQTLAFYENFQAIKIFDRTMNLTNQIDLNKLNLFEIHAVGSSNDNNIWIFDDLNQELLKIDRNGKIQGRNNDLRLRLNKNATPYQIIEFQNMVYLFDSYHGLLIFNNFGEYVTQRTFSIPSEFCYLLGEIFYKEDGNLIRYTLKDGLINQLPLDGALRKGDQYYIIKGKIIFMEDGEIRSHRL